MRTSQLYRNNKEMIATDGQIWIDGRLSIESAKEVVRNRNIRFAKNFPHKVADSFQYKGRIVSL